MELLFTSGWNSVPVLTLQRSLFGVVEDPSLSGELKVITEHVSVFG